MAGGDQNASATVEAVLANSAGQRADDAVQTESNNNGTMVVDSTGLNAAEDLDVKLCGRCGSARRMSSSRVLKLQVMIPLLLLDPKSIPITMVFVGTAQLLWA